MQYPVYIDSLSYSVGSNAGLQPEKISLLPGVALLPNCLFASSGMKQAFALLTSFPA